ncbi:hypothetical protein ALT721_1540049 [Alteromonas alvinellae]
MMDAVFKGASPPLKAIALAQGLFGLKMCRDYNIYVLRSTHVLDTADTFTPH